LTTPRSLATLADTAPSSRAIAPSRSA